MAASRKSRVAVHKTARKAAVTAKVKHIKDRHSGVRRARVRAVNAPKVW